MRGMSTIGMVKRWKLVKVYVSDNPIVHRRCNIPDYIESKIIKLKIIGSCFYYPCIIAVHFLLWNIKLVMWFCAG